MSQVMRDADTLLAAGRRATAWAWPTGFPLLDTYLGGGIRAGELCLLGGPQGLGKTTFALQLARNVARSGGSCAFLSYEHDATTLLERLVALEAGELFGVDGVPLRRVREALEDVSLSSGSLEDRLGLTAGGAEAVSEVRTYADRLLLHRSLGSMTDLDAVREVVRATVERTERRPLVVVDYLQKVLRPEDAGRGRAGDGRRRGAQGPRPRPRGSGARDRRGRQGGPRAGPAGARCTTCAAPPRSPTRRTSCSCSTTSTRSWPSTTWSTTPRTRIAYRQHVVLSVEKNRSGLDRIDLQLRKRFEQARYETEMVPVDEQLLDDRVFKE